MKFPRRAVLHLAVAAPAVAARLARAQAYPSRGVRIVVGFAAGGTGDILCRLIGRWLAETLGQPFVIANRPGQAATSPPRRSCARPPTATPSCRSAPPMR
ncbi:MAG: hypothetical protein J2P47_10315 [Acetobacteraceae bacterium]|nr:hypothetical protein [Acetobacteraceae bacterium]